MRLELGPSPKNKVQAWPKSNIDLESCKRAQKSPKFGIDTKAPVELKLVLTHTLMSTILQN